MAIWNRGKDEVKESEANKHLCPWDTARCIDATEAENPARLPIGWYIYKKNFLWHGLKPNPAGTDFLRGYDFQTISEAEAWLGVPAPQEAFQKANNRKPISEQLLELQGGQPGQAPPADGRTAPSHSPHTSNRRRNIDIHIKVTQKEYDAIREKIELSEMTQTAFLIQAALNSQIRMDESKKQIELDLQQLNEHLRQLRGEVGRIGGMLKMVIQPNLGQRELNPSEWDSLIITVRSLVSVKEKISRTMEAINGYSKTHFV